MLPEEIAASLPPFEKKQISIFRSSTRWLHCLTTAVVLELMLRNNYFGEKEIRTGTIAASLHDAAITPFSDLVSAINPLELDEANNLPLYLDGLNREKKDDFDRKYSPDYQTIFEAVKGKGGSLGTFLKIADRLAYTALDSALFVAFLRYNRKTLSKRGESPLEELVDIFEEQPKLFDVFKEVKFDPQSRNAYFEDPQKMALFLRVRALMFTHVYLNPQRLSTQAVARKVIKELMDGRKIEKEDFLKMTDADLQVSLFPDFSFSPSNSFDNIGFIKVENEKELGTRRDIFWIDKVEGFDTLTYWLVRDPKDGGIKPFSEVYPEETAELEKLNHQSKGVVAYFVK